MCTIFVCLIGALNSFKNSNLHSGSLTSGGNMGERKHLKQKAAEKIYFCFH